MTFLLRFLIVCKEAHHRFSSGQTMTEYALILAAVAVAAFVAFSVTGQSIDTMVTWTAIDKDLLGS